jgi:hypothetical protein
VTISLALLDEMLELDKHLSVTLIQAKVGKVQNSEKNITSQLSMLSLRDYLHLAGNHPCPFLHIDYWMGHDSSLPIY